MKKMKFTLGALVLLSAVGFAGCEKAPEEPTQAEVSVTVTESVWADGEDVPDETTTFDVLAEDDVISDTNYGTISVEEVTEEEIVLDFDGAFVEKEGEGINLNADPLEEFTIEKGETVVFASQTMDAGVTVTIVFE